MVFHLAHGCLSWEGRVGSQIIFPSLVSFISINDFKAISFRALDVTYRLREKSPANISNDLKLKGDRIFPRFSTEYSKVKLSRVASSILGR
ncbi:hypothetical protein ACU8KH_01602 [Lachancea thermotolerans]